ncbi:MAG: hypothetical protein B6D64_01255 [Bacteroidetes bacterium 4484_276]|nr:MAG: hypothetical protein B6D64_01255 [Bacteroidetes bacterium 4484_276]OYT14194.1 MAG: hypothetical protein B6I19_01180 [Bacteroidetes bacterium 4572_114]
MHIKLKTSIDEQGSIILHDLPFKNLQVVEVIILIKDKDKSKYKKDERIARLKASFRTIKSHVSLPDELLMSENIYENDGR